MQVELRALSDSARRFLESNLDATQPDWWARVVLGSLTYQQQATARERAWSTFDDLDLAALLRVVDRNWDTFRRRNIVSYEARNWLKEASSIRNRWAHDGTSRAPRPEDAYRDLDTIARLAEALHAPADVVAQIRASRDQQLEHTTAAQASANSVLGSSSELGPGSRVRLVARPEVVGIVVASVGSPSQPRYRVFHDGRVTQDYYPDQIEALDDAETLLELDAAQFHAALSSVQLRHPSSRYLYSLFSSRIEFEPYQFRPVLKLIQSDRPRLLIADDVGVGKTIEAGLIMKELQARQDLNSILVICPRPLVVERKWQQELKRFDEDFIHLTSETLRDCLEETAREGVWPRHARRAILPFSLLDERLLMGIGQGPRHRPGMVDLDPPPTFDLVIVDEAHHIRNPDTWRYRNVRQILAGAEAVVFMSATPIQLGNDDLFNLLKLLRPDRITTKPDFERMLEPNGYLHAAAAAARSAISGWQSDSSVQFEAALATAWGRGALVADPRVQEVSDLLAGSIEDDETRVRLVRLLEGLNTFSSLINRTRRRDIGDFTVRKPDTIEVDFTPAQQDVYGRLLAISSELAIAKAPGQPLAFLLSTLRRQAASSLNGLGHLIRDILQRQLDELQISEADLEDEDLDTSRLQELDPDRLGSHRDQIEELAALALALGDDDPKFDALLQIVRDKLQLDNHRLLLFSSFRHTLSYLERRITTESGARVGVIHGGTPDDDRRDLMRRFRLQRDDIDAIDVLLSSEVGTEGLDYQFCDALVNYDLPWNPMRVEQRIGRIDRRGQRSETVAIKNLVTSGTIDADIYRRCLMRIGVFQRALGGSEEILGDLTRQIRRIADDLTLTPQEQASRIQQQTDNQIARIQELAALEEQQAKLFGLDAQRADSEMIDSVSSPWLRPAKIAALVTTYLNAVEPTKKVTLTQDSVHTLRPTAAARAVMQQDFQALDRHEPADEGWNRWLKSGDPTRLLTVDPDTADRRRDVDLLGPTHPLTRAGARHASHEQVLTVSLSYTTDDLPPGDYAFGVFGWNRLGVKDDFALQLVAADEPVQPLLTRLIPAATASRAPSFPTEEERRQVQDRQDRLWADARTAHREAIALEGAVRRASLEASHRGRVALLEDQIANSSDPKIRRMKEAELASAEADAQRRIGELDTAVAKADLTSNALAFGTIQVSAS